MKPLLISGFGTSVTVDKRKLIFSNKAEDQKLEFYPHQISYDSVIIDGNYGFITFEAIRWLMKHDVSLITLNWNGDLLSVTLPKETASAKLRMKQYETYHNKKRYDISRIILNEKVNKSLDLLRNLSKYHSSLDKNSIETAFNNIKTRYKNSNDLLTYEGNIAIVYWNNLQKAFNGLYPEFAFTNRNGRQHSWNMNASDEINALLNYGYAILEAEVRKAINSIGFDPTIGFLHELKDGRMSLVYDIQELYRWLIDLSIIQLLEDKGLKKSDFIVTENYNIRLTSVTAKALLDKITLNFNKTMQYKGKQHSYGFILLDNVRNLASYVTDTTKTLTFDIPEIGTARNDPTELRNHILSMTSEERKQLGIRRNTLWYMKKNVKKGKRIKVYTKILERL